MRITFVFLLTLSGFAQAQSLGYYSAVEGKAGLELRNALNGMLKAGAMEVPYSAPAGTTDTAAAMRVIDEALNDTTAVRLVYSGLNAPKADLNNMTGWDRAHLWPNSYGIDSVGPAYSDLHNLRPCDSTVNGSRSNLLYDDSNPEFVGYAVPGHPEAPGTSRDGNSWEMPDSEKGDIARAMFYMDVRYEGTNGEPNLQLTDDLATVTASNSNMGRFSSLLVWHILDPVSPEERVRNDRVFAFQGNRNPFVDRPEWVLAVYGNPFELKMTQQPESSGIIGRSLFLTPVTYSRRLFFQYGVEPGEWKNDLFITMGSGESPNFLMYPWEPQPRSFFRLVVK
jgi:endonuclease I